MNHRTALYVRTVAKEGSFSKAAEKLYISQPSLSENILKAEKEYGVQFFNRKTTPVVLTYAGQLYLKTAEDIDRLDEQLTRQLGDINDNAAGRIVVGESPTMSSRLVPYLFKTFHQKYPDVQLVLKEGSNPQLIDDVRHGRSDIAFVSYDVSDLVSVVIADRRILLSRSLQKDEERQDIKTISLKTLEGEPFILLSKGREIRNLADAIFEKNAFRPGIAYETQSYILSQYMAEAGLGWTFTIDNGKQSRNPKMQYFQIADNKETYHIRLVYRKDTYISKPLQYFMDIAEAADHDILQ